MNISGIYAGNTAFGYAVKNSTKKQPVNTTIAPAKDTVSFGNANYLKENKIKYFHKGKEVKQEVKAVANGVQHIETEPETLESYKTNETGAKSRAKKSGYVKIKKSALKKDIGIVATVSAALTAAVMGLTKPSPNTTNGIMIDYNPFEYSVSEIADIYGSDKDIIISYNHLDEIEDITQIKEIYIPGKFDYIQNEIDKYSKKLESSPSDKVLNTVRELTRKQNAQKELANVYADNDYVYIELKTTKENPELAEKYGKGSIPVEQFKALFDIKDGYIRANNNIRSAGVQTTFSADTGFRSTYYDYTNSYIIYGSTIKVPKEAIDTKHIKTDY